MSYRKLGKILVAALGAGFLAACAPWPYELIPPVHGLVVDVASRAPIAGATVRIQEFPETAVRSSSDGSFSIAAVRKWQVVAIGTDMQTGFRLVADAPGYTSAAQLYEVGGLPQQVILMRRVAN